MARQRHPRGIDDGDGITDDELLDLASNIAANDYFKVGSKLDIPYNKLEHIKVKHLGNYIKSMLEILHSWKDRQSPEINISEELYQRLRAAGLDKDGSRLRIGPHPSLDKTLHSISYCVICSIVVLVAAVLLIAFFPYTNPQVPTGEGAVVPVPGCSSSPCLNGGTCMDLDGTYKCKCEDGFGGSRCDEKCVVGDLTLSQFQDLLRDEYNRGLFKIQIKPWDPDDYVDLEKLHTVVSLNKKDKMNIANKSAQKITLPGSINDVFQTKIGGKLPERIVLVGKAGRGKTTAVAKMAYDWVNRVDGSPLKEVPLLFVLKMRHLKNTTSLAEGVLRLLGQKYVKNGTYHTQLKDWIDSHEKDVFILMDGYDEYIGDLKTQDSVSDVIYILRQDSCKCCRVLVTTRPVRETDFTNLDYTYAKMELEGFSEEHAMFFIDMFFKQSNESIKLKRYLEDKPVMTEMITTPLFCTMMCYMWGKERLHESNTQTALFDNIMDFLFKHANGMTITEKSIKLDDLLIHVGGVAYHRMLDPYRTDLLHFIDGDFINETIKTISFKIGLLTKTSTFDKEALFFIEFFHQLAQEYVAGKYLSNHLNTKTKKVPIARHIISMEVLRFASGTSDLACEKILHEVINGDSWPRNITLVLTLINEADKCAANSETDLSSFFWLERVDLENQETVNGFEKLPSRVKNQIGNIVVPGLSAHVYKRLWETLFNCTKLSISDTPNLTAPSIEATVPWDMQLGDMPPFHFNRSFKTTINPSGDNYIEIISLSSKMKEFEYILSCGTPFDRFTKVWNSLSGSSHLNRLSLDIPSTAPSELKTLTSVKVFETHIGSSSESFNRILHKLPYINNLTIIRDCGNELTHAGFSELWSNLSILPYLHRLELYLPHYAIPELSPLWSVKVFKTDFSTRFPCSDCFLNVFMNLPNIHELIINSDLFGGMVTGDAFWIFWKYLHHFNTLTTLRLCLSRKVPSGLSMLKTVKTFEVTVELDPYLLSGILDRLPSVQELIAIGKNVSESDPPVRFHDVFLSTLTDSVMKRKTSLKSITVSFISSYLQGETISRDTVRKFTNMLKSSPGLQNVDIDCKDTHECLFKESDLLEIVKAARSLSSLHHLRISCVYSTGELRSYLTQNNETEHIMSSPEENSKSVIRLILYREEILVVGIIKKIFSVEEVWFLSRL